MELINNIPVNESVYLWQFFYFYIMCTQHQHFNVFFQSQRAVKSRLINLGKLWQETNRNVYILRYSRQIKHEKKIMHNNKTNLIHLTCRFCGKLVFQLFHSFYNLFNTWLKNLGALFHTLEMIRMKKIKIINKSYKNQVKLLISTIYYFRK